MGYYINPPDLRHHGKGEWLIENYDAVEINTEKALRVVESQDTSTGVICIVDNGAFEAAAFCFNRDEFDAFTQPNDNRPKRWLSMDLSLAEELSGYASGYDY